MFSVLLPIFEGQRHGASLIMCPINRDGRAGRHRGVVTEDSWILSDFDAFKAYSFGQLWPWSGHCYIGIKDKEV